MSGFDGVENQINRPDSTAGLPQVPREPPITLKVTQTLTEFMSLTRFDSGLNSYLCFSLSMYVTE